jgi:uncharacterized protein (TIGR03083 family)
MSQMGVDGLRAERESFLTILKSLRDDEWNAPSGCEGWAVRDVVAHLSTLNHGVVDPTFMPDTSGGTEPAMEAPVAERRAWTVEQVLDEYGTYSEQALGFFAMAQDPPLAETMLPLGDIGTHPMSELAGCFLFDVYCHLRHDILRPRGSIDRPEPPRDELRLRPTVEWMLTGLPWMSASSLAFMDRPLALKLDGPGGGSWTIGPGGEDGRVLVSAGAVKDAVATARSGDHDFVAWGTGRRPWREAVQISGDEDYGSRFLDAVRIF